MCLYLHPLNPSLLNLPFKNKAVSDGALSFYHDCFIHTQISSLLMDISAAFSLILLTWTTKKDTTMNLSWHQGSKISMISSMSSCPRFIHLSSCHLLFTYLSVQDMQVLETKEFRETYWCECSLKSQFKRLSFSMPCYWGAVAMPKWKDVDPHKSFSKL